MSLDNASPARAPAVAAEPPAPQRRLLSGRADFANALNDVINKATRTLRMFDPTVQEFGLNSPQREEQLRSFLLASRNSKLLIAVHDPQHITIACPRLMRLLRQFSHAITIHRTNDTIRNIEDVLVIADDLHCLRKPHAERPNGAVYFDDPVETRGWNNRFNEIWEQSTPSVSATTIGL
jgi:hypothetical protein